MEPHEGPVPALQIAAEGAPRLLLLTIKDVEGGPAGQRSSPITASAQSGLLAGAAGAHVLAALPAWDRPILLPPAWSSKLSTLSQLMAGGEAAAAGGSDLGLTFTVLIDTPEGPAAAAFLGKLLLGSSVGRKGRSWAARVRAEVLGRGSSSAGSGSKATTSSSESEKGDEEGGSAVVIQARLAVQEGGEELAGEEGGAAELLQGRKLEGEEGERSSGRSGGGDKGLMACLLPDKPEQARALAIWGVLGVVASTWLHLFISSPIKAVAVLKSVAFFVSALAAMVALPLLGLKKLPGPAPSSSASCRQGAGGSPAAGTGKVGARACAGGEEPSAKEPRRQWMLTLSRAPATTTEQAPAAASSAAAGGGGSVGGENGRGPGGAELPQERRGKGATAAAGGESLRGEWRMA